MDIRKSKYIFPNLFTLTNAFLGFLSITWAAQKDSWHLKAAAVAILMAMLADMMDGRIARLTRTQSRFGVQLDSLSDALSFGMAPAVLAYMYGLGDLEWAGMSIGTIAGAIYLFGGILRLARFNVTAEKKKKPSAFFEGMPIPAAAAILVTFIWATLDLDLPTTATLPFLIAGMPILGLLMISRVRYYSFKDLKAGLTPRIILLLIGTFSVVMAIYTKASYVFFVLAISYGLIGPLREFQLLIRYIKNHLKEREDLSS